ncbi:MAG: DNA-directed RNA polymerase [Candidatus Hodarchaeales archaeon]|jgi:DNA-directed RNA polymerase subunit E'
MYYLSDVSVTIQVPPNRFGERIDTVVLELAREKYENSIHPDIGMIVAVLDIRSLMPGKIVPGEGSTFHDCIFSAITYRPVRGEFIEGEVAEVIKFGVFIRVGCTDCLCHISQISNEKMEWQSQKGVLVGRESNRRIQLGDMVRAKIINTQIDHLSMKIAVTMRDTGTNLLGAKKWITEFKEKGDVVGAGEEGRRRIRKKRRKKKRE